MDCKYCIKGEALISGKHLGLAIYYPNKIYIRGFDKQGWDSSEAVKINYCPMCGRKLEGSDV